MNFIVLIPAILIAFVASEKIYIDNLPRIKSDIDLNINDTSEIQPRIIGGKPARRGQFPYQVGLDISNLDSPNNNEYRSWCGGSLISINYVLTAAHCVYLPVHYKLPDGSAYPNPNVYDIVPSIEVYLGLLNTNYLDDNVQIIHVPRMNIVKHYAYNRFTIQNDIALLKLTQPAQLNGFVQLINLPKLTHNKNDLLTKTVTSSGWGVYTGKEPSTILRYAEFGVLPYHHCVPYFNDIIDEQQMCIYKPRKSACMGDSGGPNTVTETNGQKTLYGITSFVSLFGCEAEYPTVLTRVSGYLDWIQQHSDIHISS